MTQLENRITGNIDILVSRIRKLRKAYEYWLDSFLPISGQFIFCCRIRIMQMKRKKFTLGVNKRQQVRHCNAISLHSCTDARCDDINKVCCPRRELTSIAIRMGVLMIHHGSPSIISQHLFICIWRRDGGKMGERWGRDGGEMEESWRRDRGLS